jgi:hypothetical protein
MQYRFTSDSPLIFSELSYGPDVYVTPTDGVEGSTVVLNPGDILTVTKPLDHAWLEEIPEPEASKPAKTAKPAKDAVPVVTPPAETPPAEEAVPATPPATPTQGE